MCSVYVILVFITLHDRVKTQSSSQSSLKHSKFDLVTNPIGAVNLQAPAKANLYSPHYGDTSPQGESKDEDEDSTKHADIPTNSVDDKTSNKEEDFIDEKLKEISKKTIQRFSPTFNLKETPVNIGEHFSEPNNEAPRTISNFPVNILRVVTVTPSPKSSVSKEVHKIESKMSSVRVVVNKAPRSTSTVSTDTSENSEKKSKLEVSTQGNTELSSKFRAPDEDIQVLCSEGNIETCQQVTNYSSGNDKFLIQEINNIKEDTEPELISEAAPDAISYRDPANESVLELSNSFSLPLVVSKHEDKTSQQIMSFQEKVKQIRDILAHMEQKNDSHDPDENGDYDYYDNEELSAQIKYLRLFEQKYGRNGAGSGTSSNPFYTTSPGQNPSSLSAKSKDQAIVSADTIPVHEVVDISKIEDIRDINEGFDRSAVTTSESNSTEDRMSKFMKGMQAQNFSEDVTSWLQSSLNEARLAPAPFSKQHHTEEESHEINLKDMMKALPPSRDWKPAISVTPSVQPLSLHNANQNLMKAAQSLFDQDTQDFEERYPVKYDLQIESITIPNVNSVFPICTTNSTSVPNEETEAYTLSTELEAPPLEVLPPVDFVPGVDVGLASEFPPGVNVGPAAEFSPDVEVRPVSELSSNVEVRPVSEFAPHVEIAPAVDVVPGQAISQPLQTSNNYDAPDNVLEQSNGIINTFLYNYEENNSIADTNQVELEPLEPPLFLDSVVQDIPRGGGFQHFSANDLDSEKFTSSFSNAQTRMYELYRDLPHLTASTSSQDSSNKTNSNSSAAAMPLVAFQYLESRCFSGNREGLCFTSEMCAKKGGRLGSTCNFQGLFCCTFTYSCGAMSKERVTYFKSPHHPARPSSGLTCDYDVAIRQDVCAVRLEFEKVNLARKLGGVCDIDQLFILNSLDGPTTGQCGPLSGYATTVAVKGSQIKPLKIALLIQSATPFYWYIKVIQLSCSQVRNFKAPARCGRSIPRTFDLNAINSWQRKWHRVGRKGRHHPGHDNRNKKVWWKYPEPILNTYYFSATKKHLQQFHQGLYRLPRRRIISGGEAEIGEFPWQVAIALDGMFFCGGALLNEHFVLTAAHCIMTRDTPVGDLVLHVGDHDLTQLNETSHVRRGVRRVLYHSHFHPFVLSNDIALLQLDRPVAFTDTIQPVCLPHRGESFIGKRGHVVGWGVTSFPMGEPSPVMQKLEVKVLSNARCATVIEESIGIGMLCAAPDDTQGTCFGDSGGPLTFEQDNGYHVLAGIVSYGVTGCAIMPAYPDLYTRISEYIRWIQVNAIVTK